MLMMVRTYDSRTLSMTFTWALLNRMKLNSSRRYTLRLLEMLFTSALAASFSNYTKTFKLSVTITICMNE
jgi:hypothetical protein